jgi:predicted RNA methylase
MEVTPAPAGFIAALTTGQLPRDLYLEVDKALQAHGGKWTRKHGGHLFQVDPTDVLDEIATLGEYTNKCQDLGAFDTPPDLAAKVAHVAALEPGMSILEPSAGLGNLMSPIAALGLPGLRVTAVELDPNRARALEQGLNGEVLPLKDRFQNPPLASLRVVCGDFLTADLPRGFDCIVMNPPFARQADIDHVTRALELLSPGGRLVAIMSAGVAFRTNRKTRAFLGLLDSCSRHVVSPNPPDSFKASGTCVNTVNLVVTR